MPGANPDLDLVAICRYTDDHPDLSPNEIAQAMTKRLTKAQLYSFALAYVEETAEMFQRTRARKVEEAAERSRLDDKQASREQRRIVQADQDRQIWFDDPASIYLGGRWIGNSKERKAYRRWLGDRFEEWYGRGRAALLAAGDSKALEDFESDWYPDGMHAYYADRRQQRVWELIREVSDSVRLETTKELLLTFFALGDGARVTWGEATTQQHEQRVALLVGNAAGNVETAARHQAAIRMIEEAGVTCLSEIAR